MQKTEDGIAFFYTEQGNNCAETVFKAACEAWALDTPPETARLMAGFGGGMGVRSVCGALSGAIAALSYRDVNGTGHKSPELMARVRQLMNTAEARFGSVYCRDLHPEFFTPEEKCLPTIRAIAQLLDALEQADGEGEN